jgi:hypothetical protein
MTDIPTSLDELVRDSRARIETLRKVYGNREDFDFYIRRVIGESLEDRPPKVRAYVLTAMFGKESNNAR